MWHRADTGRGNDVDQLVHDLEQRLAGLRRMARRSRAAAPTVDRMSDVVASALTDFSDRFRGRAHAAGGDAAQLGEDAFRYGNDALRKLTREVEQRPLLMLAIAAGVGALAAGIFVRRD